MNKLPETPLSSSAIAEFLNVSKPTIADYYKKIRRAFYWMPDSDFCLGSGNKKQYTVFCIQQMESLSVSSNHEQWISEIQSQCRCSVDQNQEPLVAEIVDEPGQLSIIKPEYTQLAISELKFKTQTLDLTEISQATGEIVEGLNKNLTAAPKAFGQRIIEKYRLAGRAIAQQAFHAMAQEMNEELNRLGGDDNG